MVITGDQTPQKCAKFKGRKEGALLGWVWEIIVESNQVFGGLGEHTLSREPAEEHGGRMVGDGASNLRLKAVIVLKGGGEGPLPFVGYGPPGQPLLEEVYNPLSSTSAGQMCS